MISSDSRSKGERTDGLFCGGGSVNARDEHQWINQDGKKINLNQLDGSPIIVTLTYTSCPVACPLMVSHMKSFERQLTKKEKTKVKFMTFSIDPDRDTPAALRCFIAK